MRWFSHPAAPTSEDVPWPPRLWWTRRVVAGFVAYFALLVVLQAGWDWYMYDQVQRRLATWRERGEPWRAEDFGSPTADDSGVQELCAALVEIGTPPVLRAFDLRAVRDHPVLLDLLVADIDAHLARNEQQLKRARAALHGRGFELKLSGSLQSSVRFGGYRYSRHLSDSLALFALLAHRRGNDATATDALIDMVRLSDLIASVAPSQYTLASAADCMETAADYIEEIAPTLQVASSHEALARSANRDRVRQLIELLLDDTALVSQQRLVPRFERVLVIDDVEHRVTADPNGGLLAGATSPRDVVDEVFRVLMRPCFRREANRAVSEWEQSTAQNMPALQIRGMSGLGPDYRIRPSLHPLAEWTSEFTTKISRPIPDFVEQSRLLLARRRMSAVALALRLYELEQGDSPVSLEQLVPGYLSRVPDDPWSPEGGKVKWKRASPSRLYCAGWNQRDDGGEFFAAHFGVSATSLDTPFFLTADRPRIPWRHIAHLMPPDDQVQVQEGDRQDDPNEHRENAPDDRQGDGDP